MLLDLSNHFQLLHSQAISIIEAIRQTKEKFPDIGSLDILRLAKDLYHPRSITRLHSLPEVEMLVTDQGIEVANNRTLASTSEDELAAWAVALAGANYDALEVGHALKNEFPETNPRQLNAALKAANYGQPATLASVACVFQQKIPFEIEANPKWQETGFKLEVNPRMSGKVTIVRTSGVWTANPDTGMVDADGNSRYIAKEGYTLPGEKEGALIGRLDQDSFLVGNHGASPSRTQGSLAFIINDDLSQFYGAGFTDNQGSLSLELSFSIILANPNE